MVVSLVCRINKANCDTNMTSSLIDQLSYYVLQTPLFMIEIHHNDTMYVNMNHIAKV